MDPLPRTPGDVVPDITLTPCLLRGTIRSLGPGGAREGRGRRGSINAGGGGRRRAAAGARSRPAAAADPPRGRLHRQDPGHRPHQAPGGLPRDRRAHAGHGRHEHLRHRADEPPGEPAHRAPAAERPVPAGDLRRDGPEPLPGDGADHAGRHVERQDRARQGELRRPARRHRGDRRAGGAGERRPAPGDQHPLRRRRGPGARPVRRRRARSGAHPAHLRRARDLARARGRPQRPHRHDGGTDRPGLGPARGRCTTSCSRRSRPCPASAC